MATTTNYGWTTPDDTALVKDGAAAIRTLGSSVDTTTKALNPETTLGDIAYRSSTANVKTRLGLGTAGQVLTVNSGATAPEWATSSSGGMTLISTTSASNTATISLTSIPGTYKNLIVQIRNFKPATDEAFLQMRYNSDATASRHVGQALSAAQTTGISFDSTSVQMSLEPDNSVSQSFSNIEIFDYANTVTWKFGLGYTWVNDPTTTTQYRYRNRFAGYNQTGAITSLDFFASTGNITSGDFLLYGVK